MPEPYDYPARQVFLPGRFLAKRSGITHKPLLDVFFLPVELSVIDGGSFCCILLSFSVEYSIDLPNYHIV
jgi:hypothetical protein